MWGCSSAWPSRPGSLTFTSSRAPGHRMHCPQQAVLPFTGHSGLSKNQINEVSRKQQVKALPPGDKSSSLGLMYWKERTSSCKVSPDPHTHAVASVQVPCMATQSPFALPTALQQPSCHNAGLRSCHQAHVTHTPNISPSTSADDTFQAGSGECSGS